VKFAENYLLVSIAKCMRSCQKPAKATPIQRTDESLTVAYVCPESHVSRIVYFATNPDAKWFESFLRNQLGDRIRSRDIRKATRHGWELDGNAEKEIPNDVTQFYWTFYARNEEEKNYSTILCMKERGGCGRLFTQSFARKSVLCPDCLKRRG
jgi:hypothetical protein